MSAHYDDPAFSYPKYWQGREYEHQSEVVAINALLNGKHFKSIVDIGGGYGRLIPILSRYTRKVTLIEPSLKQRNIAKKELKKINILSGNSQKTGLPDHSVDLAVMVRVMHHLPHPQTTFAELERIIKPGGWLLLEFANSTHFKAKLKSLITGQPILPIPIERRSVASIRRHTISFVNHHPLTIRKYLHLHHFQITNVMSVSNLRSSLAKQIIPQKLLLKLESVSQSFLGKYYFGPSIFVLAQRIDK